MKAKREKVRAWDIAARLEKMDCEKDIRDFGPKILALMRGVSWEIFRELDEKPGAYGYMKDRFYMLRCVRNHPDWGRAMFDGLKK